MARQTKAELAKRVMELEAENLMLRLQAAAAERNALPCPGPHYPWSQYPQYPTYPERWGPTMPGITICGDGDAAVGGNGMGELHPEPVLITRLLDGSAY